MLPDEIKLQIIDWIQRNGLFALIVIGCVIVALTSLLFLPKDNPIEQAAEKEIEIISGLKVDLTP